MKMSIWNLLTIIMAIATFGMLVIFGFIFILPNQVLPQGMRPVSVPPTVELPTATETQFQFPPTWTKAPLKPTETEIPTATNTPTRTNTPEPSQTGTELPPTTLTLSVTVTRTPTKTRTNTPISVVVTGASKTATKVKTATKTLTPTTCPAGVCGIDAIDDDVNMAMNPAFVEINVIANDDINGIPVKIPRLFDCANKCETDKWGNYTTKQGGLVRILSSEYSLLEAKLKYTPPVGFMGMDSIDYKITTEGGLTDIAKVIFVVTDGVQEPPTNITSAPASLSIDENLSAGTNIGSFTATDANGGPHVFTLVSGTGSTDNYNLSLTSGGILSSAAVFNAENKTSLSIRVRATDPFTFYYEEVFTITVNDLNEYPVYITSNGGGATANISVAENSTAVTTVTSSDADADDVPVYSITGGADAGSFSINGASGVLTFGSAPDFETPSDTGANNVYEVTVQVSDGTYTDSQTISVTVTNVNEAPVITEGGNVAVSMSVDGNPTPFSLTLNATDVDAGTTLTWSISSAASHGTASASGTGTSKVISYTPDALYAGPDSFTVQVSDGSGGTDTIVVNVTVGP